MSGPLETAGALAERLHRLLDTVNKGSREALLVSKIEDDRAAVRRELLGEILERAAAFIKETGTDNQAGAIAGAVIDLAAENIEPEPEFDTRPVVVMGEPRRTSQAGLALRWRALAAHFRSAARCASSVESRAAGSRLIARAVWAQENTMTVEIFPGDTDEQRVARKLAAAERCLNCGRAPVAEGYSRSHSRCDTVLGDGECDPLTIARLRAELAAVEKLNAAERAVVDAALTWNAPLPPNDTERADKFSLAIEGLERACNDLLALRNEVKNG